MTGFPGEASSHPPLYMVLKKERKKTMKKFLLAVLPLCLFLCVFVSPAMALGQQRTLIVPNTPLTLPQASSGCQVLQEQLAQIRHLLQFSRVYPGDDTSDPQIAMIRNATRASLLKQMVQSQMKLGACLNAITPSRCEALQGQLAQIGHLLQFSRVYPGDDSFDPQIVITRVSTRASLLKQLSRVQMKLQACLSSSDA